MLPLTWLVVMISCSYSSSHQTDRGQDGSYYLDRRIIILCRAVVSSHCYPKHKHFFFFPESIEFADPQHPNSFQLHQPPHCNPLGIQMQKLEQAFSKQPAYLSIVLSIWPHRLFVGCFVVVRQLKESVTKPSQLTGLQLRSPAFVTPINFGSLAIFTKSSQRVIELVQQYNSFLMVKCVFFLAFCTDILSQLAFFFLGYSAAVFEVSAVITFNEKGMELFT